MKIMYRPTLLLLVAFACVFLSFSSGRSVRTVKVHHDYSMEIPSHMKKTKSLNDEAKLQYQDPAAELYIIVIDESKKEFVDYFKKEDDYIDSLSIVDNYRRVQMKNIGKSMSKIDEELAPEKTTVNGLDAEIVELHAYAQGIDPEIFYKFEFIEGPENLYMVMTWTLNTYEETHSREMNAMLRSFRLQH